jgi:hypothetical protein
MILVWLMSFVLVVRYFEFKKFILKISDICDEYDWKYIDEHPSYIVDKAKDKDNYFMYSEWSAFNFLFLKGPSPKKMFLSFRKLSLEKHYSKEVLERLEKYGVKYKN